jgi:predicted enzyme related to lactoylglutathione lyase
MIERMRTYEDAKAMAKSLRDCLAARNVSLSHSECLEIVARQFGFGEWNTLSAKLDVEGGRRVSPETAGVSLQPPVPMLWVASLEEARPFYEDFLGFQFDWGFTKGDTYAQISRSNVMLHLDQNAPVRAGAALLVRMSGMNALHHELSGKGGPFSPTEISFTPYDSRVFFVTDPFGNRFRFWENNPPGVAMPAKDRGDS